MLEPLEDRLRAGAIVRSQLVALDGVREGERAPRDVAVERRQDNVERRTVELPERGGLGGRTLVDLERVANALLRGGLLCDNDVDGHQDVRRDRRAVGDLDRPQLTGRLARRVVCGPHQGEVGGVIDVAVAVAIVPAGADADPHPSRFDVQRAGHRCQAISGRASGPHSTASRGRTRAV